MNWRKIALFIISVNSLLLWDLLTIKNVIGGKMTTILVVLSLILFVFSSFFLLNDFKFESSYFKFIITLFFCYEFLIVIRGWSFGYNDIKSYLQDGWIFWPFVVPVFIFFDKKIVTYGFLFKWIFYSGLFFLFCGLVLPTLLLSRSTAETFVGFSIPCGFLLLNATYLKNRKVNILFLIIFISIISLTYLARRSSLVTFLGFVISSYFINIINKSSPKIYRYLPIIIIIGAFILFNQYFENIREMILNKLVNRISEDTRSNLFYMFFKDLRSNMVFGKGMSGEYYFPLWGLDIDGVYYGVVQYRNVIENGYLQLLLTGGIVHIVLFVLVLLPAAIRGIFLSSNQFAKACGVVIFLRLVDMFIYGLPTLNLSYIIVWICVGICYKSSVMKMTNDEIRCELKKIDLL